MKNFYLILFLIYSFTIQSQSLVIFEEDNGLAWIVDFATKSNIEFAKNSGIEGDVNSVSLDEENAKIYISTIESFGSGENAIYEFDYSGNQLSKINTPGDIKLYNMVYDSQAEKFYFLNSEFLSQRIYSLSKDGITLETLVESTFIEDIVLDNVNNNLYVAQNSNILKVDLAQGTQEDLLSNAYSQELIDIEFDPISNDIYVVSDRDGSANIPAKIKRLPSGANQLEQVLDIGSSRPSSFTFNSKDTLITWTDFLTTEIKAIDTNGENQQIIFEPSIFDFSSFEIFSLDGSVFIESFVDGTSSVNYKSYEEFDISVTPNPSNGSFQLLSNQSLINPIVNIYNQIGELIKSQYSIEGNIDLPVGHYFVQIIDEKQKLYSIKKVDVIR